MMRSNGSSNSAAERRPRMNIVAQISAAKQVGTGKVRMPRKPASMTERYWARKDRSNASGMAESGGENRRANRYPAAMGTTQNKMAQTR